MKKSILGKSVTVRQERSNAVTPPPAGAFTVVKMAAVEVKSPTMLLPL